jgi:iron complex outermembrane receptor protein
VIARFVVAFAFVLMSIAPSSAAQLALGSISGGISDSSGAPIAGATVSLRPIENRSSTQVVSDAAGTYRFGAVAAGEYDLRVEWPGFAVVTRRVTAAGGDARTEDVMLQPAPIAEEVTVSFTAPRNQTALKYAATANDVPLSVTSYTDGLMEAIGARRIDDVFPYINGVTRSGDTAYDFTIRGVRSREPNNVLVDGLPGLAARFGTPSVVNVERIEVLRGPASVLYGQIQPGGLVNLVTKRPKAQRLSSIDVWAGSFAAPGLALGDRGLARVDGDFTGAVAPGSTLTYRFIFSYDRDSSFRTAATENNVYVTPAITWTPSATTSLTVQSEYRSERTSLDNGLVAPNNDIALVASPQTRYQEPHDSLREDGASAGAHLAHALSSRVIWTTSWRSLFHDDERQGYENVAVLRDGVTLSRRDRVQFTTRRYHYVDTNVAARVTVGHVANDLLAGFNGGYELRAPEQRSLVSSPALNINLYAPVYGAPEPRAVPGPYRRDDFFNYAFYLQDHVDLTPAWKALLAIRTDAQDATFLDYRSGGGRTTRSTAVLPLAGIVYGPRHWWSAYASYSTSFAPANPEAEDARGENRFRPERGRQVEVGAKASLARQVDATVSLFRIVRADVLNAVGAGVSVQSGEESSRGLEIDLRTRPASGLQVIAGYALTDAQVTRDDNAINLGSRVTNVPRHSANAWIRYDVREGVLRGVGLGLGTVYRDVRAGSSPAPNGSVLKLPAYVTTDAAVYLSTSRFDAALRVRNLTNRQYFQSALSAISIQPGSPRDVLLSLGIHF